MTQAHTTPRRPGRPPSDSPFDRLLHIRITGDMDEALTVISEERMDRPTVTQLVREAIAMLIERERQRQ